MKDLDSHLLDRIRTRIIIAPVDRASQPHLVELIRHLNPDAEIIMLDEMTLTPVDAAGRAPAGANDLDAVRPPTDLKRLSPRQREVLEHLVSGSTNKEIARCLGISPSTVRVHVSALLRILDVSSRTAAAATFAACTSGDQPEAA